MSLACEPWPFCSIGVGGWGISRKVTLCFCTIPGQFSHSESWALLLGLKSFGVRDCNYITHFFLEKHSESIVSWLSLCIAKGTHCLGRHWLMALECEVLQTHEELICLSVMAAPSGLSFLAVFTPLVPICGLISFVLRAGWLSRPQPMLTRCQGVTSRRPRQLLLCPFLLKKFCGLLFQRVVHRAVS